MTNPHSQGKNKHKQLDRYNKQSDDYDPISINKNYKSYQPKTPQEEGANPKDRAAETPAQHKTEADGTKEPTRTKSGEQYTTQDIKDQTAQQKIEEPATKERTIRKKIGEVDIDSFFSAEFLMHVIQTRPEQDVKFVSRARIMMYAIMAKIHKTAEHAFYGKTIGKMDYTTGYYTGGKEIELFAYLKETEMPKAEFLRLHQNKLEKPVLEDILQSDRPTIKLVEPRGVGIDFWVDDSYGRVSEIRIFPNGRVVEEPHGRASVLIRDPVKALAGLPNHEFYKALDDKEVMDILKCAPDLDCLIAKAKTYNEVRAKLINATTQAD